MTKKEQQTNIRSSWDGFFFSFILFQYEQLGLVVTNPNPHNLPSQFFIFSNFEG